MFVSGGSDKLKRVSTRRAIRRAGRRQQQNNLKSEMRLTVQHLPAFALRLFLIVVLSWAAAAQAQIQRSFLNPSFEDRFVNSAIYTNASAYNNFYFSSPTVTPTWITVSQGEIPGWKTGSDPFFNGCPGGNPLVPAYTCTPIELWNDGFITSAPQGRFVSELYTIKLYQTICMKPNDNLGFSFAHRGRAGADSARFEVGLSPLFTFQTGNDGTGGVITNPLGGVSVSGSLIAGFSPWYRYTGSYTYTGPAGNQDIGLFPVSQASGTPGIGNIIDDLSITLRPYVEFVSANTYSVEGSAMTQAPQLRIVGRVTAPMQIVVTFNSPEALYLSDYDFPGLGFSWTIQSSADNRSGTLTKTIQAGNYAFDYGNVLIDLPFRVLDDTIIENNEVVNFSLPTLASSGYDVAATMSCGAAPIAATTHTIIDNDVQLRVTKTASVATATYSVPLAYTVTFANVTPAASTSVAPLTAHDVTGLSIADQVPANMSFTAWTCTGAGGAVCPAASGSGSISATAALPVGSTLQYVVSGTVTGSASCGGSIVNTAAAVIGSGTKQPVNASFPVGTVTQGTALQGSASYVARPLDPATVTTPVAACTSLGISKTDARTTVTAGGTTDYVITVANSGSMAADGAVVRDSPSTGLQCTAATCSVSLGAAVCPAGTPAALATALLGPSGVPIPTFPGNSSLSFTMRCAVTASGS